MSEAPAGRVGPRARRRARQLALQALYQWQMGGTADELYAQFSSSTGFGKADAGYFRELVEHIVKGSERLDSRIGEYADRDVARIDPVERAILLIGLYELEHRHDVPYRVVIDEAVGLARRFGAVGAHKYVNAVLDRAAGALRPSG